MRILVTGVTGFAGGHLAEALLAREEVELFGTSRRAEWPREWRHLAPRVKYRLCDLCDGAAVESLLREVQPEQIYHLAGYAEVGRSFREVEEAWDGNLTATRCLYEALGRWGARPRILYVSSGLVYGEPETAHQAYDERCLLHPVSPYAASKAAADLASFQYAQAPGLAIVRVRPFNHIGPRQSPRYAVPHFAQQIAAIERGQQPPVLDTGNLSPQRDLTDVRDIIQAYILLMESGRVGEVYNAGSGTVYSMQAVLDRLLRLAQVRVEIRRQPELVRSTEVTAVCCDAGKLRRETGWTPHIPLDQTLQDTLAYWREQVSAECGVRSAE
jgi:GDP-4-dehydro-6-deoxy-D-mannose reductase